jgi:hypothetical protein
LAGSSLPLYRSPQYDALDPADARRYQSMRRAADAWWRDGQPDEIRRRLLAELDAAATLADLLARWRVRTAGLDVHEAIEDWPRVYDVVQARAKGYRQPERTPIPWTAEELDKANWLDDPNPSTNVPVPLRFGRHVTRAA